MAGDAKRRRASIPPSSGTASPPRRPTDSAQPSTGGRSIRRSSRLARRPFPPPARPARRSARTTRHVQRAGERHRRLVHDRVQRRAALTPRRQRRADDLHARTPTPTSPPARPARSRSSQPGHRPGRHRSARRRWTPNYVFSFTTDGGAARADPRHPGRGHISPLARADARPRRGIVTAGPRNGFYMQDPDAGRRTTPRPKASSSSPRRPDGRRRRRGDGQRHACRSSGPAARDGTNLTTTEIGAPDRSRSSRRATRCPAADRRSAAGGRVPPTDGHRGRRRRATSRRAASSTRPATASTSTRAWRACASRSNNAVAVGPTNGFGETLGRSADDGASAGAAHHPRRHRRPAGRLQPRADHPRRHAASAPRRRHERRRRLPGADRRRRRLQLRQLQAAPDDARRPASTTASTRETTTRDRRPDELVGRDVQRREPRPDRPAGEVRRARRAHRQQPAVARLSSRRGDPGQQRPDQQRRRRRHRDAQQADRRDPGRRRPGLPVPPDRPGQRPGRRRAGRQHPRRVPLPHRPRPGVRRPPGRQRSTTPTAVVDNGGEPRSCRSARAGSTRRTPRSTTSRKPLAGEFMFNGHQLSSSPTTSTPRAATSRCSAASSRPTLVSEAQRHQQAQIVARLRRRDPRRSTRTPSVVVLGDLNDFEFSAPVHDPRRQPRS